jgi:hypothetical protein
MTVEQKRQRILKALSTWGKTPWIVHLVDPESKLNEIDYLIHISRQPENIRTRGTFKGHPDVKKIANKLNAVFHQGQEVRTKQSIQHCLCRLRAQEKF